jgi:hypothetical protein
MKGLSTALPHSNSNDTQFSNLSIKKQIASVVYWPEFPAADPQIPGSIPGASSESGTGSTHPLEDKWGTTWKKKIAAPV